MHPSGCADSRCCEEEHHTESVQLQSLKKMLFPQDFFSVSPDHSTDPGKGTMSPEANVAKLRAEGGLVGKVGNA